MVHKQAISGEAKNIKDVERQERKEKLKVQQGQAPGIFSRLNIQVEYFTANRTFEGVVRKETFASFLTTPSKAPSAYSAD